MPSGAITNHIDVAQITLYVFWGFFAALIIYLRREDKREGYPLRGKSTSTNDLRGFPSLPKPKVFLLPHGGTVSAPRVEEAEYPLAARPTGPWQGAPLEPTGNPLVDGLGPAAYAMRSDKPDLTHEGHIKLVPLRVDPLYFLAVEDADPRGMSVIAADGVAAGTVRDAWVDRSETLIRYLEVSVAGAARNVLVPMTLVRISATARVVKVGSVLAAQFLDAPVLKSPDQVTLREEDRIMAYFGGGALYATPERLGPLL